MNAGATSLGIRVTNGVVLATEKKLPSILVDEATVQKMSLLTPNVGMTYSGMGPDSRVLVRKARKSGQVYFRQYHEQIPVAQLCRETAAVMQEFTRARGEGDWGGAAAAACECWGRRAVEQRWPRGGGLLPGSRLVCFSPSPCPHPHSLSPCCPASLQNRAVCGPLACL